MQPLRSATWSAVLAFAPASEVAPISDTAAPALRRAVVLDTLDAVIGAVEPANLVVISDDGEARRAALAAGAGARTAGRDVNLDVRAVIDDFAARHPQRSAVALLGPLPHAGPGDVLAALRACAATEAAYIAADDGGTLAVSHHDPARLQPRFGGASAARHARSAVRVAAHLAPSLARQIDPTRAPAGARTRAALARSTTEPGVHSSTKARS